MSPLLLPPMSPLLPLCTCGKPVPEPPCYGCRAKALAKKRAQPKT